MKQKSTFYVTIAALLLGTLLLSACRKDLGQTLPDIAPAGTLNNSLPSVQLPAVDVSTEGYPAPDPSTLDTTATGEQPLEQPADAAVEQEPAADVAVEQAAPVVEAAAPTAVPEAAPATGEQATVIHTVQGGETIGAIAERYGVTIEDIQAANQLFDINQIGIGQELRIEAGAAAQFQDTQAAEAGFTGYDPNNYFIHTVGFGDTLFVLAQRYGFTVEELAAYNGLPDINRIDLNQQVRIPNR